MNSWSVLAFTPAIAIVLSTDLQEVIRAGLENYSPLLVFYLFMISLMLHPIAYIAKIIFDIKNTTRIR